MTRSESEARLLRAATRADAIAQSLTREIPYRTSPTGATDFESLDSEWRTSRTLHVSSENDSSTYHKAGIPDGNLRARIAHDLIHVVNGLRFTPEDELTVSRLLVLRYYEEGFVVLPNISLPEREEISRLIRIDNEGQTHHQERFGVFPLDQHAFTLACFRHGIQATLITGAY